MAALLVGALVSSCASKMAAPAPPAPARSLVGQANVGERLLTRQATMSIEVRDVAGVSLQAEKVVSELGGIVTQKTQSGQDAHYSLAVPASRLDELLDRLGKLGKTTGRSVSARDVTDEAIDLEARLKNKRALRDRLRQLLGSTTTLQEVLSLEEHLARVQAEVDALEAQQKRLTSSVELSRVDFGISRQGELGPLGYVFGGLWWGLKKLFVWR